MKISLIVAASANGVIGADGELPWHLPDDFRYFKQVTMGKPIVMGRRTWESIGRPLPGRQNIVVTRQRDFEAAGTTVVDSPEAAVATADETDELMIIGGGEIYRRFLPIAHRVYLTRVEVDVEGDTFFPALDDAEWRLASTESHPADERHAWAFEFRVYERRDPVTPAESGPEQAT